MADRKQRPLRAPWAMLMLVVATLLIGLLTASPLANLAPSWYQPTATADTSQVPERLLSGTDVASGSWQGQMGTLAMPAKTVALTFDDGPDPTWTPAVLAVLDRYKVKGTFFEIGSQIVRHPDITQRVAADGHEIGIHSFSHPNMAQIPDWQQRSELRLSEFMVLGATGTSTPLYRPPFSSGSNAVDNQSWASAKVAAPDGFLSVYSSVDAEDWRDFSAGDVIKSIESKPDRGQVVLMHDGGGDRSKTLALLERLIPELQERGYTFTTVGQGLGVNSTGVVPVWVKAAAAVGLWGLWLCSTAVGSLSSAVFVLGMLAVFRAVVLIWASLAHRKRSEDEFKPYNKPVTVIVPAYNESAGIEASIRSLVASTHRIRVLVVDDGSTDDTAAKVEALIKSNRWRNVHLLRKPNGGKSSALNLGLEYVGTEVVVMVDGDTMFEPDTIAKLVAPFSQRSTGAVSGNAKVANRDGFLGRWQHIEYVIGFNTDRRFYDLTRCMPTVPGAIGAWRTDAVLSVGGLHTDTLAEDTDLTMALGCRGWRIRYVQDAIAWTEAPETVAGLWKQRYRWSYGTMQAMWKRRHGFFSAGINGTYLRRCLPYMTLFQIVFPLLAPAVDVFALYGLVSLDPWFMVRVWLAFQALDFVIALTAFRVDREDPRALWALPLTQFGYRQLMYAVVIQSAATAVSGRLLKWQAMERTGALNQLAQAR